MLRKQQKVIWFTFVIATVLMVATIAYSYTFYFGIFKAMRTFELSISDFDFTILNSTKVVVKTAVTLNNTSDFNFYALDIRERVFLNDVFLGTASIQEIIARPVRIPPQSSKNATITLSLDLILLKLELIEFLLGNSSQKTWMIFVQVSFEGPLVERFTMKTAQTIITS